MKIMKIGFAILAIASLLAGDVLRAVEKYEHNNTELQRRYAAYNDYYFGGELPQNLPVVWADIPRENGYYIMGETREDVEGHAFMIEIDTKTNVASSTADLTLLHEMCHAATAVYVRTHNEESHGPKFQSCMAQLASEGAMHDLW